jgi:hypothetical protein
MPAKSSVVGRYRGVGVTAFFFGPTSDISLLTGKPAKSSAACFAAVLESRFGALMADSPRRRLEPAEQVQIRHRPTNPIATTIMFFWLETSCGTRGVIV